jgi:Xaa-Pro aminopeptidase
MDLEKARARMAAAGLDALLIALPENLAYATGFPSLLSNMWYEAGVPTAWALLPLKSDPAIIVPENEVRGAQFASGFKDVRGYPVWVDIDRLTPEEAAGPDFQAALLKSPSANVKPAQRPGFFSHELILDRLNDLLGERGLLEGNIGIEQDFISLNTAALLRGKLPDLTLSDGSDILRELRLIKTPTEIEHLRAATWLAERGIHGAITNTHEGTRHADIRLHFQVGAANAVLTRPELTGFQGSGAGVRVGPNPWVSTPDATVQPGDQVMFDCGAIVNGYHSDIGRSFAFRKASEAQKRIQSALVKAHDAALAATRPGNRFCDIFQAGIDSMHQAGYEPYRRGHLGHSVGLDRLEERPMISAGETRVLEPNMVLAIELPWYIDGVGGFQCEDIVRVTENGCEWFKETTRDVVII